MIGGITPSLIAKVSGTCRMLPFINYKVSFSGRTPQQFNATPTILISPLRAAVQVTP